MKFCLIEIFRNKGISRAKGLKSFEGEGHIKKIAVGNPGAGKSTFLNALAGENLFKSGVNIGKGLTYQLDEGCNAKGYFMDTPGLADETLRKAAGNAISEGLRKGGDYKVIFFVTQQAGRVNAQDATTMKLVLEAAPEIGQNYGVVVNKVNKKMFDRFKKEKDRMDFLLALFAGIPKEKRCVFDRVMFFPELDKLDYEDDVLVSPEDLVSDTGNNLETLVNEYIPIIQITMAMVSDVDTDGYDETNKKLEALTLELMRKDDEWKKQLIEVEKRRNEEMLKIQEDLRKEREELRKEREEYRKEREYAEKKMSLKDEEIKKLIEERRGTF